MSKINDDQKILGKTGRKNVLKDDPAQALEVQVSLRDQIPEKLYKKLDEMKAADKVVDAWSVGNADRTRWLNRQQVYLADWDEHLETDAEGPFEHASNLHVPMPLSVAKAVHARFLQALMGQDTPFKTNPKTDASVVRQSAVHNTMRYTINTWANYNCGIADTIDMQIWDWVTTGVGLVKVRWDAEFTRYIGVEEVQEPGIPEFMVDEEGNEVEIPTVRTVEKEVSRTEKVWEGPVVERLNPEDVLIVGGEGDPQKADMVIHQTFLTASELWTLVDRGIFKRDMVEKVIKSGPDSKVNTEVDNIKQQRLLNTGLAATERGAELDRYRILEAYLKIDVDGSGINSDVVVWLHEETRSLLRSTFLYRINKAGKRPIFKADYLKKPGMEYGTGLLEMLHPLSVEMDAMHNMRVDMGMFSTMPFGFYRPTSSMDPQTLQVEPGSLIPVDNPQTDIVFPNLGNRSIFGAQEEAALQTMVERLTGISDMALGALTGAQGPTRTATGARAFVGESAANLDVFLRRLSRMWSQVFQYIFQLLQQRIPKGLSFKVTGEDGADYWQSIQGPEDLRGDFDFEIAANSSSSNQGIVEQRAMDALQQVMDPIAIQLQIVTPREIYEAKKNFLKARGIKDVGRFLREPTEIQRMLSPIEEMDRVVEGIEVQILPAMDHEGFIKLAQEFERDDNLNGQMTSEQMGLIRLQAQRHMQMMQALEELAQQQRNTRQMQINAQAAQPTAAPAPQQDQGRGGPEGQ